MSLDVGDLVQLGGCVVVILPLEQSHVTGGWMSIQCNGGEKGLQSREGELGD